MIWLIITEDGIWIMGVLFPNVLKTLWEDKSGEGNSTVLVFSKKSWVAICALTTSKRKGYTRKERKKLANSVNGYNQSSASSHFSCANMLHTPIFLGHTTHVLDSYWLYVFNPSTHSPVISVYFIHYCISDYLNTCNCKSNDYAGLIGAVMLSISILRSFCCGF